MEPAQELFDLRFDLRAAFCWSVGIKQIGKTISLNDPSAIIEHMTFNHAAEQSEFATPDGNRKMSVHGCAPGGEAAWSGVSSHRQTTGWPPPKGRGAMTRQPCRSSCWLTG